MDGSPVVNQATQYEGKKIEKVRLKKLSPSVESPIWGVALAPDGNSIIGWFSRSLQKGIDVFEW